MEFLNVLAIKKIAPRKGCLAVRAATICADHNWRRRSQRARLIVVKLD